MVKCPECGEELKESYKKCPFCGHVPKKETKTGNNNTKIIAVIAVIVVIAIVGVFLSGMLGGDTSTGLADKVSSASDGEYWASINGEKFHLPDCEWAEKISEDNKIIYHSREDAIADGKVPCGECDP